MAAQLLALLLALPACPAEAQAVSRKDLGRKALETVVAHLKSPDSDVRAKAAEILGAAGNKAALGMLKGMLADKDKYVRVAAARALWELGSPAGVKTVYAILNDIPAQGSVPVTNIPLVELKIISQNKIRENAMAALAWMKGEKAAPELYKLKNDNYGTIRDAAARELAKLGHEEELTPFVEALASEDEAIRYESAGLMARICAAEAAAPLTALLKAEKSVRVKMAALDALKCNPSRKEAADELLKLADDQNPTIKYKAVAALSGIKDPKVQARQTQIAASTNDIRLKISAQKGLMLAGGQPDKAAAQSALDAVSPEVKLEALDVIASFPDDDAAPLLAQALEDVSVPVKLEAALQVLKRFTRK
jgi:HEAT repeat protein